MYEDSIDDWEDLAIIAQNRANWRRTHPRHWFRYYFERVVCVIVLLMIVIAGLFAFVQLLGGQTG